MEERTRVTLELDWSAGRIAGAIGLPRLPARPFSGYVELMAALEGTRPEAGGADAPGPGSPPGQRPDLDEEEDHR